MRLEMHKNQKAHEVTRDVTAWAGWVFVAPEGVTRPVSGIGPILIGKSLPGLGPPRSAQHEVCLATRFVQTVWRRRFSRRRSPNGVAWRFPDWTAVGFRFRSMPASRFSSAERCEHHPASCVALPACNRPGFQTPAPGPVPRIGSPFTRPLPGGCCELGPTLRVSGNSLPAVRGATCGDVNPTCLMRRLRAH
jgi:hypothetical protein